MKDVVTPLDQTILLKSSATDAAVQEKTFGLGVTTLIISKRSNERSWK